MSLPPQFMEVTNGVLFIVFTVILFILTHFLYRRWREFGWRIKNHEDTAYAIGFWVIIFGQVQTRSAVWLVRHAQNTGGDLPQLSFDWITFLVGTGTLWSVIGGVCVIRVLTPHSWGEGLWLSTLVMSVVLSIVLAL